MWRQIIDRGRWLLGLLLGLLLVLTPAACAANPPLGLTPAPPLQPKPQRAAPPPKLKAKTTRPIAKPSPVQPDNMEFQPFFDRESQSEQLRSPTGRSADATPPLPKLNKFDQSVLAVCGEFGSRVEAADVRRLFAQSPDVVKQIKQAVDGEIFAGRDHPSEFLDDLVQIWTENHAFSHIFCGEIKGAGIGGLHYVGRYAQLQQQGQAGRLADNQSEEEVAEGAVYTVGIELQVRGRILRDRKKGYAYPSDAAELLEDGTWAFKQFQPGQTEGTRSCLYSVNDPDATPFDMVFVKTDRAIVTLYPDATPPRNQPHCE
jgi:Bacterial EndoU nuclease